MLSLWSLPSIRDAWATYRPQSKTQLREADPRVQDIDTQRFPSSPSSSSNGSSRHKCIFWLPSKLTSSDSSNQEDSEALQRSTKKPFSPAGPLGPLKFRREAPTATEVNSGTAKGVSSMEAPCPPLPKWMQTSGETSLTMSSETVGPAAPKRAGQESPTDTSSSSLGPSSTKSAPAELFNGFRFFRDQSKNVTLASPRLAEKRKGGSVDQNSLLATLDRLQLMPTRKSSGDVTALGASLRFCAFELKLRKMKEQYMMCNVDLLKVASAKSFRVKVPRTHVAIFRAAAGACHREHRRKLSKAVEPPSSPPLPPALLMRSRSSPSHGKSDASTDAKLNGGETLGDADRLAERIYKELGGAMPREQLEDLAAQGMLAQIPRDEHSGELGSVGSLKHAGGTCSPCAYWFKGVCVWSLGCRYCHLLHEGQSSKRLRPSKSQRLRRRKRGILQEEASQGDNAEAFGGAASNLDLLVLTESTECKDEISDPELCVVQPTIYSF